VAQCAAALPSVDAAGVLADGCARLARGEALAPTPAGLRSMHVRLWRALVQA
jgi:hypothetical protein